MRRYLLVESLLAKDSKTCAMHLAFSAPFKWSCLARYIQSLKRFKIHSVLLGASILHFCATDGRRVGSMLETCDKDSY